MLRNRNPAELQAYIFYDVDYSEIVIASYALGEHLLTMRLQENHIHAADLETLEELVPGQDEIGSILAARYGRALDRQRLTRRFFADFAAQRDNIAAAWVGLAPQARRDREQLALLLLSRLMFLYFLQHRGFLAGDRNYLFHRFESHSTRRSFYTGFLKPLFFYSLNRRPERRPARAVALGDLPYLNGGLFERHVVERKYSALDLPDEIMAGVFRDLLEKYRFTAREAADAELEGVFDVGVDPEMLGRVFEGLMAQRTRATTGTFYTPAAVVDRVVAAAIEACGRSKVLREVRVLDPACGSGAFLLSALSRIAAIRGESGPDVMAARRRVVAEALYGVDLQSDAALLCALRLWLALVPARGGGVQPLPNLDRKIRQGDSLVDPLELNGGLNSPQVRSLIGALKPVSGRYVVSEPDERPALQRALQRDERKLARAWIGALQRKLTYESCELRALSAQKDLFGAITAEARRAQMDLRGLNARQRELVTAAKQLHTRDERPFFSYAVHFADAAPAGFDMVLCNPPWVRSHNWPRSITDLVKRRFSVCSSDVWRPPHNGELFTAGGHQIDLALLFLERSLELLAPGGALGIILPAKFMRSISGGAARRLLLQQTDLISIEDHSLDQRSIFQADAFAAVVVARKKDGPRANSPISVTMVRRGRAPQRFTAASRDLSLAPNDAASPWLIVPPDVRKVLDKMGAQPVIGDFSQLKIRRGVVTGSNAVMLLCDHAPKLGGLCEIRSEGYRAANPRDKYVGVVEQAATARVARGSDVRAWSFEQSRWLLCRNGDRHERFPRLLRYLQHHDKTLSDVPKVKPAASAVAWHDLASNLNAVVLPPDVVALNTVYYIGAEDPCAHLLCAYFNSLPVRVFARAIAERAKDAHFRFFAWTISMLPLPADWKVSDADGLTRLSRIAHEAKGVTEEQQAELDALIGSRFGLSRSDLKTLARFDAWLRGA